MFRHSTRRSLSTLLRLQQQRGGAAAQQLRAINNNGNAIRSTALRSLGTNITSGTHQTFRHASTTSPTLPTLAGRTLSTAAVEAEEYDPKPKPFAKLMAANRGEIATRIMRAGSELGCSTVGIYSHEGTFV